MSTVANNLSLNFRERFPVEKAYFRAVLFGDISNTKAKFPLSLKISIKTKESIEIENELKYEQLELSEDVK